MDISGKVALITGSAKRIGRSTALELAKRAAERFPADAEVSNLCARAYAANREYDLALTHARAAVERKPDTTEYQLTLADAALRSGDFNGALHAAQQAIKLEPGSAPVHATVAAFLIIWASSATTVDHDTAPRCWRSRGSRP